MSEGEKKDLSVKNSLFYYWIIFILIFPPIVDLTNGYMIGLEGSSSYVGLLYRAFLIVTTAPFILFIKEKKLKIFIFFLVSLWIVSNIMWAADSFYYYGNYDFTWESDRFSRVILPYFFLSFFLVLVSIHKINIEYFMKFLAIYSLIIAMALIFSYFTGIGFKTYEYSFIKFGVKSFFNSQNDLSLALLIVFPMNLYLFLKELKPFYFITSLLIFLSLLLIATRAGTIGGIAIFLSFAVIIMFYGEKEIKIPFIIKLLVMLFSFALVITSIFLIIELLSKETYLLEKFYKLAEESPRKALEDAAQKRIDIRPVMMNYFGEGFSSFLQYVGLNILDDVQSGKGRGVEQDILELSGAYGYILGGIILSFPVFMLLKQFYLFFTKRDLLNFSFLISIAIFVVHSALAGHAITSTFVAHPIAIVYLYIIKSNLFTENKTVSEKNIKKSVIHSG